MTDPVKRAEDLLAMITPGEWSVSDFWLLAEGEDAAFIIECRNSLVRDLCAEVKRLRYQHEAEMGVCEEHCESLAALKAEVKALREEREKLKAKVESDNDIMSALRRGGCAFIDLPEYWAKQEAELTSLRGVVETQRTALEKIADDETDYPRQVAQEALLPKVT